MGYEKSPRIRDIVERLIDEHHPHLRDAKELIEYYTRDDSGVDWAGKCKKCSSFERFLTGMMFHVFIIDATLENWSMDRLEALVDHELCHIQRKTGMEVINPETGKVIRKEWAKKSDPDSWYIREHDVEEFSDVIHRHGLWDYGIEKFAEAVRKADYQMTIYDAEREQEMKMAQ
ncbi:putative metallopeptidase [Desulfosporosinus sp. SYSU MS00001]|uniref:putative metallopeptidase n=1 Tax=Desulfosporosinus sp. SYSU MS00001 TaxID=3416284 RepID=UPI003CF79171